MSKTSPFNIPSTETMSVDDIIFYESFMSNRHEFSHGEELTLKFPEEGFIENLKSYFDAFRDYKLEIHETLGDSSDEQPVKEYIIKVRPLSNMSNILIVARYQVMVTDGITKIKGPTISQSDRNYLFHDFFKKFFHDDEIEESEDISISIAEWYLDRHGDIRENNHHKLSSDFADILDVFYPGIDIPAMIDAYLGSSESILLLVGPPGTGKTSLIKRILYYAAIKERSEQDAVYAKDVNMLRTTGFWANLSTETNEFVILDDLDDELKPRQLNAESVDSSIVNKLSSFGDGLFQLDTKVIITTNLEGAAIDDAIIRRGRCFDVLRIPLLTPSQAADIWTKSYNLPIDIFESSFSDKPEISQAQLAAKIEIELKSLPRTYLKDQTISVRDEYIKANAKES